MLTNETVEEGLTKEPRRRRGRPPQADRAQSVAEAILRVLAVEGTKGLTHRRVDREAGLPIGSSVHHASTRAELLRIAAERLVFLTLKDLQKFVQIMDKHAAISPQVIAKEMIYFWRTDLLCQNSYRLSAEMALLFSQEFRHEIHQIFRVQVDEFNKFWVRILKQLGVRDPDKAAKELTLWSRGIFGIMAACQGELQEEEYAMFEDWAVKMLRSFTEEPSSVEKGSHKPPRKLPVSMGT